MSPAAEHTSEQIPAHDLAARIQAARDQLTPLVEDAPTCEDIDSKIPSDRALKRDITLVNWSR